MVTDNNITLFTRVPFKSCFLIHKRLRLLWAAHVFWYFIKQRYFRSTSCVRRNVPVGQKAIYPLFIHECMVFLIYITWTHFSVAWWYILLSLNLKSMEAKSVVVILDADKEPNSRVFHWALNGLSLKPGDKITLVAVLHQFYTPSTYSGK